MRNPYSQRAVGEQFRALRVLLEYSFGEISCHSRVDVPNMVYFLYCSVSEFCIFRFLNLHFQCCIVYFGF